MTPFARLLSTIIFLLMLPFAILMYCCLWLIYQFFFMAAQLKFQDSIFQPTSFDILASMGSELSKSYYNVVYSLEGREADITHIKNHYYKRIFDSTNEKQKEISRKWSSILVPFCGYFVWKECSNFDINNHIKFVELEDLFAEDETAQNKDIDSPSSMSAISWETVTERLVTVYGPHEILGQIPKWQLLVLRESSTRYTCLFKVHHSISDGMHFARLLKELVADKVISSKRPITAPSSMWNSIWLALTSFSLLPYGLWASAVNKDRNSLHGPQLTGVKNFHVSSPIEVERIKHMKHKTGATVNDVLVTCVSKALTEHFLSKSEEVPFVTSLLPISRHIHEDNLKMKNNIAISSVQLPTTRVSKKITPPNFEEQMKGTWCSSLDEVSEYPSLLRLAIVKNNLDAAKDNPMMMSICWFMMTVSSMLPTYLSKWFLFMDGTTLNISNMNGPQHEECSIAGATMKDIIFLLNDKDPLGIAVSLVGFHGVIRAGLIADTGLMSKQEGHQFVLNILKEVDNLEQDLSQLSSSGSQVEIQVA